MRTIRFENDYLEGACSEIMARLVTSNYIQTEGYGEDTYCYHAAELIKKRIDCKDAQVHFLVGGTQANLTVISSVLRPFEGVISAKSGHINCHETGAIEGTGHKVLALDSKDGKLTAEQIKVFLQGHLNDPDKVHTVKPGLVYISQPTECGTLYFKEELEQIKAVCTEFEIPIYIDGARLAHALAAPDNDVELKNYKDLCDIFYIGGTKCGALFGEAVVIVNEKYQKDFRYSIKRQGGMLAKGRLLGIQFYTLFENDLYTSLAKHANDMAALLRDGLKEKGYKFLYETTTNQIFPILTNGKIGKLRNRFTYTYMGAVDKRHTAVRFCTSFATTKENVEALLAKL